jgi:dihydrofolate synthase / folylpolyglutamate synthase
LLETDSILGNLAINLMGSLNPVLLTSNLETGHAPRFHLLEEWLSWQQDLHFTAIDLGLERCRAVAELMGLLDPDFRVISVAGTNGKGSSVAMLDTILRRSGYLTGKYTSPHLLKYNERICINGLEVEDEQLCQAFEHVDRARAGISLSYFEFGTLAALEVFKQQQVEIAIMEVGLGGRLDAVNILDADAALITSIDVDHEHWLGDNRNSVGREKAGIIREGKPAVCSDPRPPQSITQYADETGVKLELLDVDYNYQISKDGWDWKAGSLEYSGLPVPDAHNDCQLQNAAGVIMLLMMISDQFEVCEDAISTTMRDFRLQGRFQIVPGVVPYVLDVAHNVQAAKLLVSNLRKLVIKGKTHCVIGMQKDKNHESIFRELDDIVDVWHLVDLPGETTANAAFLAEKLQLSAGPEEIHQFDCVYKALGFSSQNAVAGDRIVVTGSFLTVSAGTSWLQRES